MLIKYSPGGQGCPGGYSFNPTAAGYTGTLTTGLVSWWSLDESSGTRADSVGDNDLSDNNTVGYDTGMNGNAAKFEAANTERLSTSGAVINGIVPASSMTISFWTKLADNDFQIFLRQGSTGGTTEGFSVWLEAPNIAFACANGTNENRANFNHADLTDAWHHIVYTFDKDTGTHGTGTIYLNNVGGTPKTFDGAASITSAVLNVGAWQNGSMGLDGMMDELGIWSRVLTEDERAELYASGSGVFYPFT